MWHFLPRRRLFVDELRLIPESLFSLLVARLKVSFYPSKKYIGENLNTNYRGFSEDPDTNTNRHDKPDTGFKNISTSKALTIAGLINGLSRRTPWRSTCLVKVLAAKSMFNRRSIDHRVHFGVKINNYGKLEAHSWLSTDGGVIIGGENLNEFQEIRDYSESSSIE